MSSRVRGLGFALFVSAVVVSAPLLAQPRKPLPSSPPAPSARPIPPPPEASEPAPVGSSLSLLGDALAKGLGAIPPRARLAIAPVKSDDPKLRSKDFAGRVARVFGARLAASPLDEVEVPLGKARSLASSSLVFVEVELSKGSLRVSAALYVGEANGWERAKTAALPPPRAHAFATRPIDAEVRAFLPPIELERAEIHKAKHDEIGVVAAACGDLDGDGGLELALVGSSRVAIGKIDRGRFVPSFERAWSKLASHRPVPLRDPMGAASVVVARSGRASLFLGTTTYGGVVLSLLEGGSPVALSGLPVLTAGTLSCAGTSPAESALEGLASCTAVPAPAPSGVDYRFDAASSFVAVDPGGAARAVTSLREPSGKVHVQDGADKRVLEGAGADVVVSDFDLDGAVEVAMSGLETEEVVSVVSLGEKATRLRRRIPVPSPVRALAACPAELNAAPALVVVTDSEVWLVR